MCVDSSEHGYLSEIKQDLVIYGHFDRRADGRRPGVEKSPSIE